jgi:hypothetical protein
MINEIGILFRNSIPEYTILVKIGTIPINRVFLE